MERPSLIEKQKRLMAMPGYRAHLLIDMVKRISYILQTNIVEYNALVERMQKPEVAFPILDWNSTDEYDKLMSETERLLHNVVAAAMSRVDQQRRFVTKALADDLQGYYAKRVKADFDNDTCRFIQGLRNYVLHRSLPVTRSNQTISSRSHMFTFVLSTKPLLEWEKWQDYPGVESWIRQQEPEIPIVDVVNDYGSLAREFDAWLCDIIEDKHYTELHQYYLFAGLFDEEVKRVFEL